MTMIRYSEQPRFQFEHQSERPSERGISLIEVLIGLMIFALVGTALVALTRSNVTAREHVATHMDRLLQIHQMRARLKDDFLQLQPRAPRLADGSQTPLAFVGRRATENDRLLMRYVTFNAWGRDQAQRSSLSHVEIRLNGDQLVRRVYAHIDPSARTAVRDITLAKDVKMATIRYFRAAPNGQGGHWQDVWGGRADRWRGGLPAAIELTLDQGTGPVVHRFLAAGNGL